MLRRALLLTALAAPAAVPAIAQTRPIPATARQLVVVTTPSWTAVQGTLRRYVRASARTPWTAVGAPVPVNVGNAGLGWGRGLHGALAPAGQPGPLKAEGDGRAPAGVFRLTSAFGYAPAVRTGLPYLPVDADVECVDEGDHALYNRIVHRDSTRGDYRSHEEMRRPDDLYRVGVVVAHNGIDGALGAAAPRGGSCIFLHQWRGAGQPTVGCTAMAATPLDALVSWLDAARAPVLVQLPASMYRRLRTAWQLPR